MKYLMLLALLPMCALGQATDKEASRKLEVPIPGYSYFNGCPPKTEDCIRPAPDIRIGCPPEGCRTVKISSDTSVSVDPGTNSAEIKASDRRVVLISNAEYEHLQKLRQAVKDAETEIAKAHGVGFGHDPCHITTAKSESGMYWKTCDGTDYVYPDRYQFRGQFLLINLPKGSK